MATTTQRHIRHPPIADPEAAAPIATAADIREVEVTTNEGGAPLADAAATDIAKRRMRGAPPTSSATAMTVRKVGSTR